MQDVEFRQATSDDVVGIVYVQATSWITNYQNRQQSISESDIRSIDFQTKLAQWQHILRSPHYKVWVVSRADHILAFLAARKDNDNELYEQHTLPGEERQGYGDKLLEKAGQWFTKDAKIILRIPIVAKSGLAFYKQHGFMVDEEAEVDFIPLPSGKRITTIGMVRGEFADQSAEPVKANLAKRAAVHLQTATNGAAGVQLLDTGQLLSRSQLAKKAGLRTSTVKYYTEIGLLPFVQAEVGLARRYHLPASLDRVERIKNLKAQGLSIKVIRQQLAKNYKTD